MGKFKYLLIAHPENTTPNCRFLYTKPDNGKRRARSFIEKYYTHHKQWIWSLKSSFCDHCRINELIVSRLVLSPALKPLESCRTKIGFSCEINSWLISNSPALSCETYYANKQSAAVSPHPGHITASYRIVRVEHPVDQRRLPNIILG